MFKDIREGNTKNFLVCMLDSITDEQYARLMEMEHYMFLGYELPLPEDGMERFITIEGIDRQVDEMISKGNGVGVVFYYDSRFDTINSIPVTVRTGEDEQSQV